MSGWVRNRPDGSVEAAFEGAPDEVARLVAWANHGPPTALVEAVAVFEEEPERLTGFEIRSGCTLDRTGMIAGGGAAVSTLSATSSRCRRRKQAE